MDRNSKVYLSGPITGVPGYKKIFKEKQRSLRALKIKWVINPAKVISHMPYKYMTYEQCMTMCYAMMSMCDTIYLMKGWKASNGCRKEESYARAHGMKIYDEEEE